MPVAITTAAFIGAVSARNVPMIAVSPGEWAQVGRDRAQAMLGRLQHFGVEESEGLLAGEVLLGSEHGRFKEPEIDALGLTPNESNHRLDKLSLREHLSVVRHPLLRPHQTHPDSALGAVPRPQREVLGTGGQ